ncbi:hypothetical protein NJO91_30095 [Streptomyces microflavus]|uniref:hypothetical protein n=1 Tax=Streptomyces microflavus TaxID=1919 RepID=UPI0029A2F8D2|nr:hypothetical protein [Streptomyces microflavus]MDX2407364.1 hypothetical protein [Streptomyces microflavus]
MTTIDSTPTPDPTTPAPDLAPAPVPPALALRAVLLLAVGMFVFVPIAIALVFFLLDRPNVRDSMDATGSFLGGTAGWGALILSLVLCVLQGSRDRPSP